MSPRYLFFMAVLALQLFSQEILAQNAKPNVLIICIDDLKDWVGYLEGYEGQVFTPNIDRLAEEGVAFTNAHTASPVCNPSRNAFFLGKRPSTTGLYNNNQWWKAVYEKEIPLPQYFKLNGYHAAGAGKVFHNTPGNNPPCSWDEYQEFIFDSPWNYANWSVERFAIKYGYRGAIVPDPDFMPLNGMLPVRSPMDWGVIPGKAEEEYGDVLAAKFAADFLGKPQDKPFFLSVGIFNPHLPWYVPQKYFDMYPLDKVVLPVVKEGDVGDLSEAGKKLALHPEFGRVKEAGKWKEAVHAYLASISFADAQVGAVMNALKASKYAKNTIVVLWSDHGWHLGSKGHWHKNTLWEESTRIPFVVKVPGIEGNGKMCSRPVDMVNVFPTLLSLCGLPMKEGLDGYDMTTLLNNPGSKWPYPAISEHQQVGNVAIRSENWRYIKYHDGTEELYNSAKDPYEWDNLANGAKHGKILQEHRKWIPKKFLSAVDTKEDYFFDPYQYSWLNKKTKQYIDGKQ